MLYRSHTPAPPLSHFIGRFWLCSDAPPHDRERLCAAATPGERRFIQVFTAEVGLTPKLYHRVRRFQRARALVGPAAAPDWARLAVDCGYFDQSHLIRDFLAFSGLSPEGYLLRQSERVLPNHVPLPG